MTIKINLRGALVPLALTTSLLVIPHPAFAEPAAPSVSAPSVDATQVGDPEVKAFARATVKLHALDKPTPQLMAELILKEGMSVERYNEIAGRMQTDATFRAKVNAALIEAQRGSLAAKTLPSSLPQLPTSGAGAKVLAVLDQVCLPMVRNDLAIATVAPSAGLQLNKRDNVYAVELGADPYRIEVLPRGANPTVCRVRIRFATGQDGEIARALNIWTMHRKPEMKMVRNDVSVGADGLQRTTLSWERSASGRDSGLVFVRTTASGDASKNQVNSATLLFSEQLDARG